jgi:hypothetical protein
MTKMPALLPFIPIKFSQLKPTHHVVRKPKQDSWGILNEQVKSCVWDERSQHTVVSTPTNMYLNEYSPDDSSPQTP